MGVSEREWRGSGGAVVQACVFVVCVCVCLRL